MTRNLQTKIRMRLMLGGSRGLNTELEAQQAKMKEIVKFVNGILNGNIDGIQIDAQDEMTRSLVQLYDTLEKRKKEDQQLRAEEEKRNWITEGLAKLSGLLYQNAGDLKELSFVFLCELVRYVRANQGGIYLLNDENTEDMHFQLMASYAFDRKKFTEQRIELDEGLIGTCWKEREVINLSELPPAYMKVTSGLGEITPGHLLLVPLVHNTNCIGVLELSSFKPLEDFKVEFLRKIGETMAIIISGIKGNYRTEKLLEESRQNERLLAIKEEEIRQKIEELQHAQNQAAIQNESFISFSNCVNHTLIRAEYTPEGTLLYANTKFMNKLGYSSYKEIDGKSIFMFIHKKDRGWFEEIWESLSKGGKHFEGDMKHVTKQGQDLWTMATYTCFFNAAHEVVKIVFLAIDTTEQKKISLANEAQINGLNLSSLKAEFMPSGKFVECNSLFSEAMGCTPANVKEKSFMGLFADEDKEEAEKIWKSVLNNESFKGQVKVVTGYGNLKWLRATIIPIHDMYHEITRIVFIAHDATKEKEMELEAIHQTDLLREQEEKLRLSRLDLRTRLKDAREEMKVQYQEIEKIKLRNEKTLEGAIDAIFTMDQFGRIEFFNKAAEDLWQVHRDDVLGKNIDCLFPGKSEKDEFISSLLDSTAQKIVGVRREISIINTKGDSVPVIILLSEARVNNDFSYTAFIQNISVELF